MNQFLYQHYSLRGLHEDPVGESLSTKKIFVGPWMMIQIYVDSPSPETDTCFVDYFNKLEWWCGLWLWLYPVIEDKEQHCQESIEFIGHWSFLFAVRRKWIGLGWDWMQQTSFEDQWLILVFPQENSAKSQDFSANHRFFHKTHQNSLEFSMSSPIRRFLCRTKT